MSRNSEETKKRMKESEEFKHAYEQEELKLDLADLVFELREKTGLNQTDFAEKVGKSRSTISRIESSRMEPSFSMIEDIADSLDKKVELHIVDK